MTTLVFEPSDIDEDAIRYVAGTTGLKVNFDRSGRQLPRRSFFKNNEGLVVATLTNTDVLDAIELDIEHENLRNTIVERYEKIYQFPFVRGFVNLSDCGFRQKKRLLAAQEIDSTGPEMCRIASDNLVMIASSNFLRNYVRSNYDVFDISDSVFSARVRKWSDELDDYVKGTVSDAPTVIFGVFHDDCSVGRFCRRVSEVARIPGTTFDMTVTDLVNPMAEFSTWSIALNQGDKNRESAIFAVCDAESPLLSSAQAVMKLDAIISF
jgi:hypothetical protein